MRALLLTALAATSHTLLHAQLSAGPVGGFLISSYTQKANGAKVSRVGTRAIPALRIGGQVAFAFDKRWQLQSGLLYAGNGHYWEDPASSLVRWFSIRTIECPLVLTL